MRPPNPEKVLAQTISSCESLIKALREEKAETALHVDTLEKQNESLEDQLASAERHSDLLLSQIEAYENEDD